MAEGISEGRKEHKAANKSLAEGYGLVLYGWHNNCMWAAVPNQIVRYRQHMSVVELKKPDRN